MKILPKIVVIVGPTGSGKTDLGVFLAKKFGGEVVNADSRQIYRGMDIGTGKPQFRKLEVGSWRLEVGGIPHHLFDVADPDEIVTVAVWKRGAERAIRDILKRGKLPIVVGGTGLYIQALAENLQIPKVPPNPVLRQKLARTSPGELLRMLAELDPDAAARLDPRNRRRIIRAIEVSLGSGKPFSGQQLKGKLKFRVLQLSMAWPREKLYERIDRNVERQFRDGWIEEVCQLLKKYPSAFPVVSGIGYSEIADYLSSAGLKFEPQTIGRSAKKLRPENMRELVQKIKYRTHDYARRQLVWLRRDKTIHWIKNKKESEKMVESFLFNRQNSAWLSRVSVK